MNELYGKVKPTDITYCIQFISVVIGPQTEKNTHPTLPIIIHTKHIYIYIVQTTTTTHRSIIIISDFIHFHFPKTHLA